MSQALQKYRALESSQRQPFAATTRAGLGDPATPPAAPRGKRYLSREECAALFANGLALEAAEVSTPRHSLKLMGAGRAT